MIGNAVATSLENCGHKVKRLMHMECDLMSLDQARDHITSDYEFVVHAAGYNGGIEWNRLYPETIFFRTSMMALNVLHTCVQRKIGRVMSIISSCAYPDKGQEVLREEDFWEGSPNPSVECHGLSKRVLHAYTRQINKQHKLKYICAVLTNCYGPMDNFNPLKTKVVGALIKKIVDAKMNNDPEIVCWGSGLPRRELMFSEDAGYALAEALLCWERSDLVNVGIGEDFSIAEVAETIASIVEYRGKIKWDTSKPDGQMRKLLDSSKLDCPPKHSLLEGLQKTIQWYMQVNYDL